jgi:hypothetical protein
MNRPEASAVGWHNDRRGKRGQCIAGLLDQRFGGQATEVEPADDDIDLLNAGQFLGIAHGIDNAGMTAVEQYDNFEDWITFASAGTIYERAYVEQEKRVK